MNEKSILVVFGKDLPKKNKSWQQQFDEVIGPKELESFIDAGRIQEANQFASRLSSLSNSDGSLLPKSVIYQGYELWWMHYDDIYYKFCLPFTQYRRLLEYLKDFKTIYLDKPPYSALFQYFLEANGCQCFILKHKRKFPPFPIGNLLQLILSFCFLVWLKITRPKLMFWTSDRFALPHKCDFRMIFIYQELAKRKIQFVEFIRSLEKSSVVLNHAWQRKRPVIYSAAIIEFLHSLAQKLSKKKEESIVAEADLIMNPEEKFWFLVATHYFRNLKGTIWSISAMKFILEWIGVKAAIVDVACNRTFHEVLACKLAGIKMVGIQHGAQIKDYCVYDFMQGFDGKKSLSVDKYGLWSEWWKDYFLKYSQAYSQEQLYISGPMRPLLKKEINSRELRSGPIKVLFISEGLAYPQEIMPYLLTLLESEQFILYFKFRPFRDGFEIWLKDKQPEVYKKILEKTKVLRGAMEEAISQCDVVVGSHSTAVLEALLQLKSPVFFLTNKWGDYFDMASADFDGFFAKTEQKLIECIKRSAEAPKEKLEELQKKFFGDPYQNGSKWVVEQVEQFLK